jgi:hypothetical protein
MAQVAMDGLTPADRHSLDEAIDRLSQVPPEHWPADLAVQLDDEQPLYLLSFTPDLRAFIVPREDGTVEVQHIVHRQTLDWFRPTEVNGSVNG